MGEYKSEENLKGMKKVAALLTMLLSLATYAQNQKKHVLFLGNSYTSANNLPQLIANVATSMGDTLVWDSETPGGYYLYDHTSNAASLNKLAAGNWDYVVLQDQSQAPSLPDFQMGLVHSSARKMDSLVNHHNACAETMYYMTWGRKNGDPFYYQIYYPWYADSTYEYMDSLIHSRYMQFADSNDAEVSPVGKVWRYVRDNYPGMELYQTDGSHPSMSGSYLAACCFYTALFRKDPTQISYNSSLSNTDATNIKNAVKLIVYDSLLNWNIGKFDSLNLVNCGPNSIEKTERNESEKLQVYPNPSSGVIHIVAGKNSEIEIYSVLGQKLDHFKTIQEIVDYEIQNEGVFVIHVFAENKWQSKIVVVHR